MSHNRQNGKESKKENSYRRFLVATLTEKGHDGRFIGPCEANWEKTPFVCPTDASAELGDIFSMQMKRLKSVEKDAPHRFTDLSFVSTSGSVSATRAHFLASNSYLERQKCYFQRGLFEEMHHVHDVGSNKDDESKLLMGYILLGYKTVDDMYLGERFTVNWKTWSGVDLLCSALPVPSTFRRIGFYREISNTCEYKFLLLIQVNRLMLYLSPALNFLNSTKTQISAYVAVYREVKFELDSEVLNSMAGTIESIASTGFGLSLRIQTSPKRCQALQELLHCSKNSPRKNNADMSGLCDSLTYLRVHSNDSNNNVCRRPSLNGRYLSQKDIEQETPIYVCPSGRIVLDHTRDDPSDGDLSGFQHRSPQWRRPCSTVSSASSTGGTAIDSHNVSAYYGTFTPLHGKNNARGASGAHHQYCRREIHDSRQPRKTVNTFGLDVSAHSPREPWKQSYWHGQTLDYFFPQI
uniref:FERM domain-containing protein n=1 Tax=Panagrellus redivivus TaxID=6233 RepID=A0A7E4W1M9_PANRE